jgi:3-oxoacid CoA-transferase subunit A
MVCSYVGENREFVRQVLSGELEIEFNPQGTLAERIRAGGAGIYRFYPQTGAGTDVAHGKETRLVDGNTFVLETGLTADLAIIKAWRGDSEGNLVYRKTARNFNPVMATAARVTIAEVEELLPVGTLCADHIHTPGIYVQRIIQGERYLKPIEKRTIRARTADALVP